MRVPETSIVQVVTAASSRMHDPKYITSRVDRLMNAQPAITQYVVAHQKELTVDGIVMVLFHASLLQESVELAVGHPPPRVRYTDLDRAAQLAPSLETLADLEPNLASYIASNVDLEGDRSRSALAQEILTHVAAAFLG